MDGESADILGGAPVGYPLKRGDHKIPLNRRKHESLPPSHVVRRIGAGTL